MHTLVFGSPGTRLDEGITSYAAAPSFRGHTVAFTETRVWVCSVFFPRELALLGTRGCVGVRVPFLLQDPHTDRHSHFIRHRPNLEATDMSFSGSVDGRTTEY